MIEAEDKIYGEFSMLILFFKQGKLFFITEINNTNNSQKYFKLLQAYTAMLVSELSNLKKKKTITVCNTKCKLESKKKKMKDMSQKLLVIHKQNFSQ